MNMNLNEVQTLHMAILGERIREVIFIDKLKSERRWTPTHQAELDLIIWEREWERVRDRPPAYERRISRKG